MTRQYAHVRIVALVLMLTGGGAAIADCGSVPYSSPFVGIDGLDVIKGPDGSVDVQFDPLNVVVYEPGQRGIILWDGQEEILLLSTEIRTSQPVSILEVIPFPSEPTVQAGDFASFEKMQALFVEKSMWKVASGGDVSGVELPRHIAEITFHEKMGAHDISVVRVKDRAQFGKWVMAYLQSKEAVNPKIDPAFLDVIDSYIVRGHNYFVFDSINTSDVVQSRQPIQYRFKTDHVYYPLEISTRETGETSVDLLVLTKAPLRQLPRETYALNQGKVLAVEARELSAVDESWGQFMGAGPLSMQRIQFSGDIQKMVKDFIAK